MGIRKTVAAALFVAGICGSVRAAADWATSQGSCFAKGDKLLSAGVGLVPFSLDGAFDYAVHDCISVGGILGPGFSPWDGGFFGFAVRGAFHPFNLNVLAGKIKVRDKLDVYGGPEVGWEPGFGWPGDPIVTLYLGAQYKLKDRLFVYAEENGQFGWLTGGIRFKL